MLKEEVRQNFDAQRSTEPVLRRDRRVLLLPGSKGKGMLIFVRFFCNCWRCEPPTACVVGLYRISRSCYLTPGFGGQGWLHRHVHNEIILSSQMRLVDVDMSHVRGASPARRASF